MTKIKRMDKDAARRIIERARGELAPMCDALGLEIIDQRGRIDSGVGKLTVKLTFGMLDSEGGSATLQKDWHRHCRLYGLRRDDFGRLFTDSSDGDVTCQYKLIGFASRSRRFPILAERLRDGKTFKFPSVTIQRRLGEHRCANCGDGLEECKCRPSERAMAAGSARLSTLTKRS